MSTTGTDEANKTNTTTTTTGWWDREREREWECVWERRGLVNYTTNPWKTAATASTAPVIDVCAFLCSDDYLLVPEAITITGSRFRVQILSVFHFVLSRWHRSNHRFSLCLANLLPSWPFVSQSPLLLPYILRLLMWPLHFLHVI